MNTDSSLPYAAEDISSEETDALLDKLAQGIVRRRLTTPAILVLETCKPLNFVGSQVMIALNPFVSAFFNAADYRKIALILEKDANLERLLLRIEALEAAQSKAAKPPSSSDDSHGTRRRFFARLFRRQDS